MGQVIKMTGEINLSTPYIIGKWNQKKYKLIKPLGTGGTASVYLVYGIEKQQYYALKISSDNVSINREYNLLKLFENIDFVVKVYEIDDVEIEDKCYHYLLLEYIQGSDLKNHIKNNQLKTDLILAIVLILIKGLKEFHRSGYILGDLKLENIMLDKKNKRIKLIDLGGVVKLGGGIKEYTPAYDRATWKCGFRRAEISYDFFTLTMVLIRLLLGKKLDPYHQTKEDLITQIANQSISRELIRFIKDALNQEKTLIEGFENRINELYNIERNYYLKLKKQKLEKWIHQIFITSLGLSLIVFFLLLLS